MTDTQKEAFSKRLIRAMRESSVARKSGTKHGVDATALKGVAGVSREMARRYLEGQAIPNPDPMKAIADWLGIRVAWLRDGEEPMKPDLMGHTNGVVEVGGDYRANPQENVIALKNKEHEELNRAYLQLSDEDQQYVLWLLRRLLSTDR